VSRSGRKLSREEAALWARLARTVAPLDGKQRPPEVEVAPPSQPEVRAAPPKPVKPSKPARIPARAAISAPPVAHGLDAGWDRKLAKGLAEPDFTLDLHGCTLDTAHGRLLHGLMQAKSMGARMVLLVTGKPRPADPADRMARRGAIRAKVIDWLAASEHAADIAAIRGAHRRHGGQGALYIILKRRRG
jgi:DNA-nicking Smr family endonuclease